MADITAQPANNGIPGAIEMPSGTNATSIDENGTAKDVQGKPVGQVNTTGQSAPPPPPGFTPVATSNAALPSPPGFKPVASSPPPPPGFKKVGASGVVTDDPQGAASQATGLSARETGFHAWLQDLQSDVRDGTNNTWFGSMLQKLGAKGTSYGVDKGTQAIAEMTNPLAALPEGLGKLGEGAIEVFRNSKTVAKHVLDGDSFQTAIMKSVAEDPQLLKKAQIGVNKVVGGAFQAVGPVAAIAAPEATLAAAPTITTGMVAQHIASKTATAMGADADTAEMVGNIAALGTAHLVNEKINPLTKRFGTAVNDRAAAEAEYTNRVRNVETARGQAAEAQQRAIDAAQKEVSGQGKPADTIAARQLANDAAANVTDAQKAVDTATKNRADSIVQVEKLHRQIMESANKSDQEFMDRFTTDSEKAKDLFEKAVPSKGAHQYDDEDYDVWRAHMEQAKQGGAKIKDLPDAYNATEAQRQGIESRLDPAVEKLGKNPITTNPFTDVLSQLGDIAKIKPEVLDIAADELSRYNLKDLTVGEARDTIKQLNNENRAAMKGASNWDVSEMIATDPRFAARYLAAKSLREGFYGALEDAGVKGAKEARGEEASLIQMRDAIGAQIRANRGGTAIRGSGEQSKLRGLVAKLTGKTIRSGAVAAGAEIAGVPGAIAGAGIGDSLAEPVEGLIAPRDMTRDEHIDKSMQYRGTLRQPVRIEGVDTATPSRPSTDLPPEVKAQLPTAVAKVPRENTDLHAELAAHYLENIGDSTYQELEDRLKKDIQVKKDNDPTTVTPAEKTLFNKITKFDAQDAAANMKANEAVTPTKPIETTTPEQKKTIKEEQTSAAARVPGTNASSIEINPTLRAQGRADESALVSHSPAMKAHAPAMEISNLEDGMTSKDVHHEEWAHTAMAAVDGLQPLEIRTDLHPKASEGAAATTAIAADQIKDEEGKYNPEMLKHQLTQWVSQKMAGPASHEVFQGVTREELKNGVTNSSDYREARALVREVYPDWTSKQVEEYIDAQYDRAHDFLTRPHIADRIRANASVREEGLPDTLHASRGRVNQFAEDIRKAHNEYEGNDAGPDGDKSGEGSEKPAKKPDAGAAGREGNRQLEAKNGKEKNEGRDSGRGKEEPRGDDGTGTNARGAVKEARISEESNALRKSQVPPERTTGKSESDEAIKAGGGIPGGSMGDLAMFHSPETGSTLALKHADVTPERVKAHIEASDKLFSPEQKIAPEEASHTNKDEIPKKLYHHTAPENRENIAKNGLLSQKGEDAGGHKAVFLTTKREGSGRMDAHEVNTKGLPIEEDSTTIPEDENERYFAHYGDISPDRIKLIHGGKEENSQARKSKSVYENIARTYGVHDDPEVTRTAGFITPDAKYIDLPVDHTQAIEEHGGPKAGGTKDNRKDFINDTGAIRVHKARERAGNVLAFSVPKDGVTPEQADAISRSVGKNGDRNGILRMERADISPETRNTLSTEQEFPSPSQVKPMLQKIGALQEETSKANKGTAPEANNQIEEHEKNGGSTFANGENLAGKDTHAVAPYPERSQVVDKLTPEILDAYKAKNADLLNDGQHAVGTWKDPETGKTYLDISKTIVDRNEAIKAGQDANQKAIYNLKTGETIPTGGTGEVKSEEGLTKQGGLAAFGKK